jgi:signal transduction histidine kinase
LARDAENADSFLQHVAPCSTNRDWKALVQSIGGPEQVYHFLVAYYEEPWPPFPEDILELCRARYAGVPDALTPGIWQHLRDIAALRSVQGRPLRRPELLSILHDRFPPGSPELASEVDLRSTRLPAGEAWYVHRDEEAVLLSAIHTLVSGRPVNQLVMGDGGTGKSSFFAWFVRELNRDPRVIPIIPAAEGNDPLDLIESINIILQANLNGVQPPPVAAQSRVDSLVWLLEHGRTLQRRFVLIVDHVEALFLSVFESEARNRIAQARYSFTEAVARTSILRNVLWVFFMRAEYFFLTFPDEDSLRILNISWVRIYEFNRDQAGQLLERLISISGKELSEDARRAFIDNAPLNPLKFVLSFTALCSLCRDDRPVTSGRLLELNPWESVFQGDFDGLSDEAREVVHIIALLTMQDGQRTAAADAVLDEVQRGPFARLTLNDVLDELHQSHLLLRPFPRQYRLYHDEFAAYVLRRCGDRLTVNQQQAMFRDSILDFMHQTRSTLHQLLFTTERLDYAARGSRSREPEDITRETRRVNSLVERLLAQMRNAELTTTPPSDWGKRVARERFSLRRLLSRVVSVYEEEAKHRRLRFVLEPPGYDGVLRGDEGLLSTVIANVLDNAVKYSFNDTEIRIAATETKSHVLVSVRNFGICVAPEERERIFERYYRGAMAQRTTATGMGIGLFLARKIMTTLGGEVSADFKTAAGPREGGCLVTLTIAIPKAE